MLAFERGAPRESAMEEPEKQEGGDRRGSMSGVCRLSRERVGEADEKQPRAEPSPW